MMRMVGLILWRSPGIIIRVSLEPAHSQDAPAPLSAADLDLACPECGYNLHGITSGRCPECGTAIDRQTLSISRLPWAHRRELGRVRAYWRTNLMVLFHPRRLAEEMNRPVSFADSQRFRHVTVLLAYLPLLVWGIAILAMNVQLSDIAHGSRLGWILEGIDCLAIAFGAWLMLFMWSGTGSYFFHPRSLPVVRQNRAVALSYYACAPLAWMVVPVGMLAVFAGIESGSSSYTPGLDQLAISLLFAAMGLLVMIAAACDFGTMALMKRTLHCGWARYTAMALYLPISMVLVGVVAVAIPLAAIYVSLVIMSLR